MHVDIYLYICIYGCTCMFSPCKKQQPPVLVEARAQALKRARAQPLKRAQGGPQKGPGPGS